MTAVTTAVERVTKALDIATKYTGGIEFGERPEGHLYFADLRTILSELDRLSAALGEADNEFILEQATAMSACKSEDSIGALAWNLRVFQRRLADRARTALQQTEARDGRE